MPLIAQAFALLAALLHVGFFYLGEHRLPSARDVGAVRAPDPGAGRHRPADGLQPGLLQPVPRGRDRRRSRARSRRARRMPGRAVVLFACACMVLAGVVLIATSRAMLRAALLQAVPPALAIVTAFVL